ncbi:hypothetical protein Tco_1277398, partial [Tanacetum coccineum]
EYRSKSEEESWTFSYGEDEEENKEHDSDDDNDDNDDEDDVQEHDNQKTESDDSGDDFVHPNLSTYKADEEEQEKEEEKAKDDDEVIFDQKVSPPPYYELTEEDENQQDDDTMGGEQEDEKDEELYGDLNINLNRRDAEITDAQINQEMEEAHITLTTEPPVKLREEAQAENQHFLNSLDSNMKRIIKEQVKAQTSKIMTKVDKYVTETLGAEVLVRSTNQPQMSYAVASSLSELELKNILMDKMVENNSIDKSDVQKNLYRALLEAYNSNKYLLSSYGEVVTLKRRRDDQDKDEEPFAGSNRGSKRQKSGKEEVDDLEEPFHQEFNTRNDDVSPIREATDVDERLWNPSGSRTPNREWNQTKTFLATPIDFSAFIRNRLNIQHLTQDLLTDPTYDLIKGTCKSVVELEYHLEEVFKATIDQLDWHNPEAIPYPHDLSKPLPLIPDARGRLIIPYDHFINNDLEYLKGGSSSRKYTTSITKTKAADYGHIKWIEDKIPRST